MTSPPKTSIRDPTRISYTNVDKSATSISPEKSSAIANNSSQFKGMKDRSLLQNTPATQANTEQKQFQGDQSYGQMSQVRNFSIKDAVGDSPTKDTEFDFQI